ncbi:hypothetical protein ACFVXQ_00125 [Kitasatospora sp. NPDC058263]
MTKLTFMGMPIEGDITEGAGRVEQKPIEELQPILQAMLDDPTVAEFGWRQYTPYFNDGEPCTFSISGAWVRTVADEDADEYELEIGSSHPTLGGRPYRKNPDTGKWESQPYEGPDESRYDRCLALSSAVEGGAFENVLLEAFGDHAEVTVRRDGIQVDFYEHE